MDEQVLIQTRVALHGVAELVIAGPQYRETGTIRLRVVPRGFGGVKLPLAVERVELVGEGGRWPLRGSVRSLAEAAGVTAGVPEGLYHDHSGVQPDDEIVVDDAAATMIEEAFARGHRAMRLFAPEQDPIIWPEHFDLGIVVDEVNYGVSPGDAAYPRPYAYVGPHSPLTGEFWNAPFGAMRFLDKLPYVEAVAEFFATGRAAAATEAG